MNNRDNKQPRSPHIQAYNLIRITSFLSITHRITGIVFVLSLPVIFLWLLLAIIFENTYMRLTLYAASIINTLLIIFAFAIIVHFVLGIRHIIWDFGLCLTMRAIVISGYISAVTIIALLFFTIYYVYA